jgi:60 kDa SS-A/Ro ribonucleoprotein
MCAGTGNAPTRKAALAALPQVARIGTHLFTFANYVQAFRGWGRGLRDAVANWYQDKTPDQLAYQAIKYQRRGGWGHRDLLRLSHPKAKDEARNAIYHWIVSGEVNPETTHGTILAMVAAHQATKVETVVELITDYNLPREAIPTEYLDEYAVWEALFEKMPITAMIRNLGKMTSIGLLEDWSNILKACEKLTNGDILQKGRVHPITILAALRVYKEGRGFRGSLQWNPSGDILDALDDAFYLAFKNVEPSNQRIMIGLDVSSSMDWSNVQGLPFMTARDAACTMAMVTYKAEKKVHTMAFATEFQPLDISRKQRLDGVIASCAALNFGGTDCALPMIYALKNKIKVDLFAVYTDNETWAGRIHPSQALQQYREQMDIPARLVVAGMASNNFSIADPTDAGMLDVVGFDTNAPQVISQFAQGKI